MKYFLKLTFFVCAISLLSSCGKNNEAGKMIPKDALFVAQINLKSMNSKLSWNDIKQTSWYQKAYSDSSIPEWRRKILENPSASGIDFDEGLIFFMAKDSGAEYIAAEGKLKSQKDFEQFNKNSDPSQTVKKEGKINLLILKDKNVVGWDNDHFVYVMNPRTTSSQMYKWNDSANLQGNNEPVDRSAQLATVCQNLFNLKSGNSLSKDEHFAALIKESGDIHVWQNTEAIIKSSSSLGMLGMLKLDAFTKDNFSTYTVNFDKGKVNVDQKTYASKELTDIVKKYSGSSVNMDMIKNIPSQDIIGLFAFNFKSEGITELIKLTGADGMVNSYAQQLGFSLDDFSKATNGDWLLALTDLKINADSLRKPDYNFLFSTGIGNKASFQKLLDAVKKTSSLSGNDSAVNYVSNDKTFALSNSNSFAAQYLNGQNNKFDFADKISGHPVAFYLDMHKILSQFSTLQTTKTERKEMLNESLQMWNNIISTGGEFKDDGFAFHTEINLINKDTNSLRQLNNYFNKMYQINQAEKEKSTAKLDSLLVPPPIDTVKVK
jgi:hypothetical protein